MPVAEMVDQKYLDALARKDYLNQREACAYLGMARDTFMLNVDPDPRINRYSNPERKGGLLYKRMELDAWKQAKPSLPQPIPKEERKRKKN